MIASENPSHEMNKTDFFGLPVINETQESIIDFLKTILDGSQSIRITTMNAQISYYALYTPRFYEAIKDTAIIPDGVGLQWAVKRINRETLSRFPGVELGVALCRVCQQAGSSVFLLGSQKGTAEKAAEFLHATTKVIIAGCMDGFFSKTEEGNRSVAEMIHASGADVLFVGMGAPYQEFWLYEHFASTGARIGIGVGGSLDVYAGDMKRAPRWIIRCNMEWLYRILQNPRRKWKVIFQIVRFVQRVLMYRAPSN